MDTSSLRQAYESFLETAAVGDFGPPAHDGDWTADLVVAHVIANDRLISAHLAEALAGREPRYDNRPVNRLPYLRAIVDAARDWIGLVESARRTSAEVLTLAGMLEGPALTRPMHTRIEDGGELRVDEPVPLAGFLAAQTRRHLPSHTEQLGALARQVVYVGRPPRDPRPRAIRV
jgi:hypothetical protein